jgi:hypothetical protein
MVGLQLVRAILQCRSLDFYSNPMWQPWSPHWRGLNCKEPGRRAELCSQVSVRRERKATETFMHVLFYACPVSHAWYLLLCRHQLGGWLSTSLLSLSSPYVLSFGLLHLRWDLEPCIFSSF